MNTAKRTITRSGLVVVAVIAICLTTLTFADSTYVTGNGNGYGNGKLEAALAYLDQTMLQPTDTVGVMVQFADDVPLCAYDDETPTQC